MSVGPIWASSDPSTISTMEWMMDCGWITTSIFDTGRPKSQWASMTSNPLFMSVAESIVTFRPMFHVGWFNASFEDIRARSAGLLPRKGPPDAVRTTRSTRSGSCPARHWCTAQCSLSTGRISTPWRFAAAMTISPAMTRISLLASAMVLPASIARSVGTSPALPGRALMTRSTSGWVTASINPSTPAWIDGAPARPARPARPANSAARSASPTATTRGRNRSI